MFDFFISHSSLDKALIVDKMVAELEKSHCSVWYDKEQISYGDNINQEIEDGLKNSFCLVLIITKNFFNSKWVYFEFGKYSAYQKARIIPVIYDISTEEYLQIIQILGNLKYINAKDKDLTAVINNFIQALETTKKNNKTLLVKDELYSLYKQLNTYETIHADIVCLSLKDYFEISEHHPDYSIMSAKRVAATLACDLIQYWTLNDKPQLDDYNYHIKSLGKIGNKNIVEYLSFIYNANIHNIGNDVLSLIDQALVSIVRWYISTRYPIKPASNSFEILYPGAMKREDFLETDEIDYMVLREDLIASVETAIEWYEYNNYTYVAIRDKSTKKIAGYFTLLPITEDTYNLILSGDFMDKEFTTDSILQYDAPGMYLLYVASVAIHPIYQNTNAFIELYNAVIDIMIYLAKHRDVYVSQILAEASTKQGEKLCKIMGMKKYGATNFDTDVYTLTLIPPEFKLFGTKGRLLMNLCKEKYEEYRDYFEKL